MLLFVRKTANSSVSLSQFFAPKSSGPRGEHFLPLRRKELTLSEAYGEPRLPRPNAPLPLRARQLSAFLRHDAFAPIPNSGLGFVDVIEALPEYVASCLCFGLGFSNKDSCEFT